MKKAVFLGAIAAILLGGYVFADEIRWAKIPIGIEDSKLTCIAVDPEKPEILYIGTVNHLYKSSDNGSTWQVVFRCKGEEKGINDILITRNSTLYIATEDGAYKSCDSGLEWEKVLNGKMSEKRRVYSIAAKSGGKIFYILMPSGLYETANRGLSWKKIFSGDEENPGLLKKITIDTNNDLYLSTGKGLLISQDGGKNWDEMNSAGLLSRDINFCLISKINGEIYVATKSGVFEYDKDDKTWKNLYLGLETVKIDYISFDSKNEDSILCLAGNSVYKTVDREPSIREVQNMAISYAEVQPNKIIKWRRGARLKAILPTVAFGIDESKSDTYSLSTNPNYSSVIIGPADVTTGWDLTFSWDLGNLIYNEHQTSIDVRSKLMVQLRGDIIDEVTRVYFERRRLQIENAANPAQNLELKLKRELRLQELTAHLDGLTGGRFAKAIGKR